MLLLAVILATGPARVVVPKGMQEQRGAAEPELPVFSDPRLADALGAITPKAGAWAEYAVLPKKGPQMRVKISVLSVRPDGSYWLESASQEQGMPPVGVKMLVHGQPTRVRDVERAFFFLGGQSPIELPLGEAREQLAGEDPKKPLPKLVHEKPQTLKLTAGEFHTEVVRVEDTRIYRDAAVPLWGLVRVQSKDRRIDLIGYALSGAVTVFPQGWGD